MDTEDREHINIWLAYSDLFSGLLVVAIGILLLNLLPNNGPGDGGEELRRRKETQWGVTEKLFEQLRSQGYHSEPKSLEEVKNRFDGKDGKPANLVRFSDGQGNDAVVILSPEGEEQRITFGDQVLFENEGFYRNQIKPEGIALLQSIGPIILAQGALYDEIRVFGHTDVKPPKDGDSLEYNWKLSSERAIAIVTELLTDSQIGKALSTTQQYNKYKRDKTNLNFPPNRLSAIGRGEFEPVGSSFADNWDDRQKLIYSSWDNENMMKQNRRIEIVLRSSPVQTKAEQQRQ